MKRLAPLLAVSSLFLFAAACGDDGDSSDDASSEDATDDTDASDDSESDDGDGSAADSAWCDVARDIEERDEALDEAQTLGREELREAYDNFVSALDDVRDDAPDEIREDVEVAADAAQEFFDALDDVDFNILDLDLSSLQEVTTDLEGASDRIEEYNERVCGIPADDDDTSSDDTIFDPGSGTIREQIVEQFVDSGFTQEEAECLADNIDVSDPAFAEGDVAAMMELFEECGLDMERLAELGESMGGG